MEWRALCACLALAACASGAAPTEAPATERAPPVHQRVINQLLIPPPEGNADLGGAGSRLDNPAREGPSSLPALDARQRTDRSTRRDRVARR
jgi:hypothetical protein